MTQEHVGARGHAGTDAFNGVVTPASGFRSARRRPIGPWAFAGVAVASLGGPLALALAAGSFTDGTRVAGSRPELVQAMCEGNRRPSARSKSRPPAGTTFS